MRSAARDRAARWVRIACWIGAVTDVGASIQMTSPAIFKFAYRPNPFHPGTDYRFAMGFLTVGPLAPVLILQAGLGAVFVVASVMARRSSDA